MIRHLTKAELARQRSLADGYYWYLHRAYIGLALNANLLRNVRDVQLVVLTARGRRALKGTS